MEQVRKPFQGVLNIIRFNWHQYVVAVLAAILIGQLEFMFFKFIGLILLLFITYSIVASLLVSWYVYDFSELYKWYGLPFDNNISLNIANISAGFDESYSQILQRFPLSNIEQLDFYDEHKHTEPSIKRARKYYPPHHNMQQIDTERLNYPNEYFDYIFLIFSAHEIRSESERIIFFKELARCLKPEGSIYVVEHLQDVPNFLAYTFGFFHFQTLSNWMYTFYNASLKYQRTKINPFVNQFKLNK